MREWRRRCLRGIDADRFPERRVRCVHCEVVAVLHGDRARCREAPTCGGEGLPRRARAALHPGSLCAVAAALGAIHAVSLGHEIQFLVAETLSCLDVLAVAAGFVCFLRGDDVVSARRTSSCRTRDPYRDQHWRCRTDSTDRGRSRSAHSPPSSPLPSATPPAIRPAPLAAIHHARTPRQARGREKMPRLRERVPRRRLAQQAP